MPQAIKIGEILVNGKIADRADLKISEWDVISVYGQEIEVKTTVYVILHKPQGYVCSDEDEYWYPSYRSLLQDCPYVNLLHVAGRLDQDTEGLVLVSSDGQFIHDIISPRKKREKEYFVVAEKVLSDEDMQKLEGWVKLDDGYVTQPAKCQRVSEKEMILIITEGKYHQVKRMLESVDNKVVFLKRTRIGDWTLDGIEMGKWRYL